MAEVAARLRLKRPVPAPARRRAPNGEALRPAPPSAPAKAWGSVMALRLRGALGAVAGTVTIASFATYRAADPSLNVASGDAPRNAMGGLGAILADVGLQSFGLGAWGGRADDDHLGLQSRRRGRPKAEPERTGRARDGGGLGMLLLAGVLGRAPSRRRTGAAGARAWRGVRRRPAGRAFPRAVDRQAAADALGGGGPARALRRARARLWREPALGAT